MAKELSESLAMDMADVVEVTGDVLLIASNLVRRGSALLERYGQTAIEPVVMACRKWWVARFETAETAMQLTAFKQLQPAIECLLRDYAQSTFGDQP